MKNCEVRYLSTDEYEKWDEFVGLSPQGNIFNKSYWLKAVSNNFKILICEENKKIIGGIVLPSLYNKFYRNPKLTPQLGVLLYPYNTKEKYSTRISKEIDITKTLIDKLTDIKVFDYNFSYNFTNMLPFIWKNYSIEPRYTYVLENLKDMDLVYNNFQNDTKYSIKKALKSEISIRGEGSIEDFYEVNKKSFERQKIEVPYSFEFLKKLDNTMEVNHSKKILFGLNKSNEVIAAVYLIYDKKCTYYLMGGTDPAYRNTGVQTLLIWEAIKFASTVSECFDFEGSTIESIENYFRNFGGMQKIIYHIYKSDKLTELAYNIAKKNKALISKLLRM